MSGKDNEKGLRNDAFLLGNGGLFQSVEGDAKMEAWSERVWMRILRKKGLEEREKHIGSALFGFELEGVA